MTAIYANPINGSKIVSRMTDNASERLTRNTIEAEVDPMGATLIARNAQGKPLGEILISLSEGNLVCHVWSKSALSSSSPIWTGLLANYIDIKGD